MNDQDVVDRVNSVFADSFEIERAKLKPDMKIFEDLGLDSLDIVDLIVALQKQFKVRIRDDERVRQIRTLGDVHHFVLTLKAEGLVPDVGKQG
ncbi:MAG: phosphopantetheine-binding protein [Candidatus Omnitrophota bacterium]